MPLTEDELRGMLARLRELDRRTRDRELIRELGRRLAAVRETAGLSRREAAEPVRLTEGELRLIEEGQHEAAFMEMVRLADVYEVSLDELAEGLT